MSVSEIVLCFLREREQQEENEWET